MNKDADQLNDLFKNMHLEIPSRNFSEEIMFKIEKKAILHKQVKRWSLTGLVTLGILGIIGIPMLIFYLLGFEISPMILRFFNLSSAISSVFGSIQIDYRVIVLGIIVLFLLTSDILLRKLTLYKKEKQHG